MYTASPERTPGGYSPEELDLLREYHARGTALASIENYARWMRGSLPLFEFDPAPHHRVIIEAIEALERGDIHRLAINVPVGHGKSHWANLVGLSWIAARNPGWSLLAVSGRLSRAHDFARQRRRILETPEWQSLAGVAPDPRLTSPDLIPYGPQGQMHAASVGQGIAGLRCDLLCVDDAIAAAEDASSPDKRDKMYQWYIAEARTRARLGEGNFLRELYIGSRWFSDDLIGRLLEDEGDTWHVIDLPFEYMGAPGDPVGRTTPGELLWPVDMFTPEKIVELKRDPVSFNALYQQKPVNAAGQWCDTPLQVCPEPPRDRLRFYCAMDLATSSAMTADYTVIGVVGVDHEMNMTIVEWHRARMEPEAAITLLQGIRTRWRPDRFLVDNDLGSKMFSALAKVATRTQGSNIIPTEVPMGGKDKETRAVNVPSMIRAGQLRTIDGPWLEALQNELRTFPRVGSKYFDDQVDVLSILSRFHPRMTAGPKPFVEEVKTIRYATEVGPDGIRRTTATVNELFEQHDRDAHQWRHQKLRI